MMKVQSLESWWHSVMEKGEELKLRYLDWDHRIRFFTPKRLNKEGTHLEGELDNGELINFPVKSAFWLEYQEGMEEGAKAV